MHSEKFWAVATRVYDNVHLALWSGLIAFIVVFAVFVVPKLPAARAQAESLRILHEAAENRQLCEHLGMKLATAAYDRCVLDLQRLRREIRNEDEAEAEQFF